MADREQWGNRFEKLEKFGKGMQNAGDDMMKTGCGCIGGLFCIVFIVVVVIAIWPH